MTARTDFGDYVRKIRFGEQATQKNWARRFQVSQATVSAWETGRFTPPPDVLFEILRLQERLVPLHCPHCQRPVHV